MKKLTAILCIAAVLMSLLTGCRPSGTDIESQAPSESATEYEPVTEAPDVEPVDNTVTAPARTFDAEKISSLDASRQDFWFGKISENGYPQIYDDPMRALIEQYDGMVFGDVDKQELILTFDCGYEYENLTMSILDTLKEKGVHATFFVTMDYAKSNGEIVKRMIDEGHTVGNHSTTHPNFSQLTAEEMREEIMSLHDYVKDNFGYEMTYFRFPEGSFNEQSLEALKQLGYKCVFWSFAYHDWDTADQMSESEALERLSAGMHKGEILLLHAVSATNTAVLGRFIDNVKNGGYTFRELTN